MANDVNTIAHILKDYFDLTGEITKLPGDEDDNYRVQTKEADSFILKISNPEASLEHLEFLNKLSHHLNQKELPIEVPHVLPNKNGEYITIISVCGDEKYIRLISWIDGRIWANINPKTPQLRLDLGKKAGAITRALLDFNHPKAHLSSHWNLSDAAWTFEYLELFEGAKKNIISTFHTQFSKIEPLYQSLPQSIIHGDVNDYNILVSQCLDTPKVKGIFDFGDAIKTQTINDIAIAVAYACMDVPDPLDAALDVLAGYHKMHAFNEDEIACLHTLVAIRLVITVTKAAMRRNAQTTSPYHSISEQPAWELLEKWSRIDNEFATYCFRHICGFSAHPMEEKFNDWALQTTFQFSELFPSEKKESIYLLDLKLSSTWIGSRHQFNDLEFFDYKIKRLQQEHPEKLIADGYLEPRPIYTASAYDKEGNSGPESRAIHLGVDFWLPAETPVHALLHGEVVTAINDPGYKQYGGLVILKHTEANLTFYTLYGHLSKESASKLKIGDFIKKGACIGYLGTPKENGCWAPHLHFQMMLSMLDYNLDFPGVTYPSKVAIFKSICPDPNLLFKNPNLKTEYNTPMHDLLHFRNNHLGKGLSVSYNDPLHIVRGDGVYLIDNWGRKYLDTVNNVAHVGHEHPKVVAAGTNQMAVLNTNTRYVNDEINEYAIALLATLPKELSVLHFVNSGSEANELAIRMAKTTTGKKKMLAIEVGYHGNTNAVIDVSSYKFDGRGGKGKPKNTLILPMPDGFRGIHKGKESGLRYAQYAEEYVREHGDIAAFIGEPIISCGGQIVPPKNYFKQVYKAVRDTGGLCIADEVQTGFGRVGSSFWAFQLHNVIPDIVTMGKPIGNGHPLAAVACTREVADAFANGMEFFNTFGGNPVSCAIGKAVLHVIKEEKLQENALEVGNYLKQELYGLSTKFPIIGEVRGEGLFLGFELVNSNKEPLPDRASYLANRMKELKILMSTDGPDHNVLKIKPPMIFSIDNAKELIFRLNQVFNEDFMLYS